MNHKRLLIISANPTSNIFNNGKTLSAFFDQYPQEKIAQLYFSTSLPDNNICSTYFRISDVDMLNFRLKRSNLCGNEVQASMGIPIQTSNRYCFFGVGYCVVFLVVCYCSYPC